MNIDRFETLLASFLSNTTQKPSRSAGTTFDEVERVSCVLFFVNGQFKRRVLEEVVEVLKKGKRKRIRLMIHPKKKTANFSGDFFLFIFEDMFDEYKGFKCILKRK